MVRLRIKGTSLARLDDNKMEGLIPQKPSKGVGESPYMLD